MGREGGVVRGDQVGIGVLPDVVDVADGVGCRWRGGGGRPGPRGQRGPLGGGGQRRDGGRAGDAAGALATDNHDAVIRSGGWVAGRQGRPRPRRDLNGYVLPRLKHIIHPNMHFVRSINRPHPPVEILRLRAGPPGLLAVVHRPQHHRLGVPGVRPVAGVGPGEQAGVAAVDAVPITVRVGVAEGPTSIRGDTEGGGRGGGAVAIGAHATGSALHLAQLSSGLLSQIVRLQEQRVLVPKPSGHHALPILRTPVRLPLLQRISPGVKNRRLLDARHTAAVLERPRVENHSVLAVSPQACRQRLALDRDQPPLSAAGGAAGDGNRVGGGGALGNLTVVQGVAEVVGATVRDGHCHSAHGDLLREEYTEDPCRQIHQPVISHYAGRRRPVPSGVHCQTEPLMVQIDHRRGTGATGRPESARGKHGVVLCIGCEEQGVGGVRGVGRGALKVPGHRPAVNKAVVDVDTGDYGGPLLDLNHALPSLDSLSEAQHKIFAAVDLGRADPLRGQVVQKHRRGVRPTWHLDAKLLSQVFRHGATGIGRVEGAGADFHKVNATGKEGARWCDHHPEWRCGGDIERHR
mmetsp:Transcript_76398/g.175016  ORF Transcript_76398/g.175016 Transcript_76398/m.175016 type:complete len:576 (+) Transcript_76398:663-2390(+)